MLFIVVAVVLQYFLCMIVMFLIIHYPRVGVSSEGIAVVPVAYEGDNYWGGGGAETLIKYS